MITRKHGIAAALATLVATTTSFAFAQGPSVEPAHTQSASTWVLAQAGTDPSAQPPSAGGSETGMHRGAAFMDRRIDRVVAKVGGTQEQADRIKAIFRDAHQSGSAEAEQHRALRARFVDVMKAPVIDRAALEQLRVQRQQFAEQRSARMTKAIADAAEVLTPEQRAKAIEMFEKRGMRHRHGPGRGMGGQNEG